MAKLLTEIQTQRKQADMDKKTYDDLVRERDILSKVKYSLVTYYQYNVFTMENQDLRKAEGSSDKLQHLMKIRDQSIQTQQQEIAVCMYVCMFVCLFVCLFVGKFVYLKMNAVVLFRITETRPRSNVSFCRPWRERGTAMARRPQMLSRAA